MLSGSDYPFITANAGWPTSRRPAFAVGPRKILLLNAQRMLGVT